MSLHRVRKSEDNHRGFDYFEKQTFMKTITGDEIVSKRIVSWRM